MQQYVAKRDISSAKLLHRCTRYGQNTQKQNKNVKEQHNLSTKHDNYNTLRALRTTLTTAGTSENRGTAEEGKIALIYFALGIQLAGDAWLCQEIALIYFEIALIYFEIALIYFGRPPGPPIPP